MLVMITSFLPVPISHKKIIYIFIKKCIYLYMNDIEPASYEEIKKKILLNFGLDEWKFDALNDLLKVSDKEYEELRVSNEVSMTSWARIIRARKLMGMSMSKTDACYDHTQSLTP